MHGRRQSCRADPHSVCIQPCPSGARPVWMSSSACRSRMVTGPAPPCAVGPRPLPVALHPAHRGDHRGGAAGEDLGDFAGLASPFASPRR